MMRCATRVYGIATLRRPLGFRLRAATSKLSVRFASNASEAGNTVRTPKPLSSVQPVTSRRRWPLLLLLATGAVGFAVWNGSFKTRSRYPSSVAELLKEGLWASVNGGSNKCPDYRLALSKYIDALKEADRVGMVPWSDEYTGIELLIADMYERLELVREATQMYLEVASVCLMALRSGEVPEADRPKLIARNLRVVLLAGILISTEATEMKLVNQLVLPHMLNAFEDAARRNPGLVKVVNEVGFRPANLQAISMEPKRSSEFEECFAGYRDELFALREMLTGIQTARGEYLAAVMSKLKTTQLMLRSGFSEGECLLSAVNVGSLLFLHALSVRYAQAAPDAKPEIVNSNKPNQFLTWSQSVFDNVVRTIRNMDQKRTGFLPEAYAMALYGRGVVASSEGDWEKAGEMFDEARLRAKGSQIQPLLEAVNGELEKVDKLRGLSKEEIEKLDATEMPTVSIMFWKLSPEIEDISRPALPDTPL